MFLSSRTRLLSRFILMEILRNVDARSSVLPAIVVAGVPVTSAVTSRDVPVTSLAPLHGASQRVGDVITAEAEVAVVNWQSTVEKRSNAAAAATNTQRNDTDDDYIQLTYCTALLAFINTIWNQALSQMSVSDMSTDQLSITSTLINKKAVLSQRWQRNAPYIWVPWKFSGLPDYVHGHYSQCFYGLLFPSTLRMFLQNLKSV